MWTLSSRVINRRSINGALASSSFTTSSSLVGGAVETRILRSPTIQDTAAFLERMNNRVGSVVTDDATLERYNVDWSVSGHILFFLGLLHGLMS